ncbi:hypothetical protein AWM79_10700 [Pseudomonas agarici]|uniref:Uncharacterized protein n=1 Tax=Pseudomonas agarici TaxID=46677 RepID=A0A0X1T111_PSEAA|nr:hypothetical protein AWM79_10700 [Pseudomonas agarici]SEL20613.1 hypothetical protein SAMN05216604_11312 [Pseudomonas agarici]
MFCINRTHDGAQIIHRAWDRSIRRTLISRDESAQYHVTRAEWNLSDANRFDSIDSLAHHLLTVAGLTSRVILPT